MEISATSSHGKGASRMKSIVLFVCILVFAPLTPVSGTQLHVCTVANKKTQSLEQLLESCKHYQVPISVLGLELPYPGNGQKLVLLKEFIQPLPDDDIVLLVDAFDVLILASSETLVDGFLALQKPCAIGAEKICYPFGYLKERFPPSPTRFKYLNSGTVMGYAGYLKKMLNALEPINPKKSDQGQITLYYLDHQDEIALDYRGNLFLTLHLVPKDKLVPHLDKKKVFCQETGTFPCIIHGCGKDGKELYQYLYDTLFKL